jgi:hypothetical protein
MSKTNFKSQPNQETIDSAVQNIQQALQEIHGVIELLQDSVNPESSTEVSPENLQEVQAVLDRVVSEFQALDQQLAMALGQNNQGTKLLNWFSHGERFKTSA